MPDLSQILLGLSDVVTLTNLLFIIGGVLLGQFVGALPGVGPVMAIAIAIPFTITIDTLPAIAFLVGIMKGGTVGGAIPAVLLNTPGTPDAAATALDGYPLAKQGKPYKATKLALYSSITGDTFSDIVLFTVSVPLAAIALKMGPVEMFALIILSFAVISGLVGTSLTKGVIMAALGVLCALVGLDPAHATPRFYFGYFELFDGLPLAPVAIGSLVMAEIFRRLAETTRTPVSAVTVSKTGNPADLRISIAEYWSCRFTMARGAVIGTILGALPGIGSSAAAFMSYASARQASKDPKSFGKGSLHGIAAAESANSAVAGANFIPLLTLGIPGSVGVALIISAFTIHGVQPGPLLFEKQGRLVYAIFGAMALANFFNFWIGLAGLRVWAFVMRAPESFIFACAIILCLVGAAVSSGGFFGIWIMLIFAVFGYVASVLGFSVIIFIIAFFLGDRLEITLTQSLVLLRGNPLNIIDRPVALALLVLAVIVAWYLDRTRRRSNRIAVSGKNT